MHGDEGPGEIAGESAAGAEANLLFGFIALQHDFISREQLLAAFDAWLHDKSHSLPDFLESQGALSQEYRELLQKLVQSLPATHFGHGDCDRVSPSAAGTLRPDLEPVNESLAASGSGPDDAEIDQRSKDTLPATSGRSLGRFCVVRPHAVGGLGQVSVARDNELNRMVALKEIRPQFADDPDCRERFVLEAEVTGSLEHPGIVPVYALGLAKGGRPYYAMRFVEGDSFKEAIDDFHKQRQAHPDDLGAYELSLRGLLGRFIAVCNAMEYAHTRGVLHRDLKPDNIMVGKFGETLVVDWGLAKIVGNKEKDFDKGTLRLPPTMSSYGHSLPGKAIGTPAYMSPEQAAGRLEDLAPVSDVYSLGATLYHLLCGRQPFESEQLGAMLRKVQHGDFPMPRSVAPEIPAPLEAICVKAMATNPVERYPSARALANDLEHWLADEPVTAVPDSLGDRLFRLGRRHRSYVRAGALAATLVSVVSLLAALLINKSRNEAVDSRNDAFKSRNEAVESRNDAVKSAEREREARSQAQDLAQRNKELADEERALADRNARLAENEVKVRLLTVRQLRIATAERLAAMSYAKRSESPEVSLLLAIESGRATRLDDEGLLPISHQALLEALSNIGGRPFAGHRGAIASLAFDPSSRRLVTASFDKTARVWDLAAADPAADPRILTGHADQIRCLAISADGRRIVTGSDDQTVRVWDLQADDPVGGQRILSGHQAEITSVAISPDNRWIVSGSGDKTVRVWDVAASNPGAESRVLTGHQGAITSLAIAPDSHWLVTVSSDKTARVWDLTAENPTAESRVLTGHEEQISSLAISPNGKWVVTGSNDNTARVWDLTPVHPTAVHPPVPHLPRARLVLAGHQDGITSVAISPDSRWMVTGSADNTARIWDLAAQNPNASSRVLTGHQNQVSSVAISPDGRWVVTGSFDNTARVWDLQTENPAADPRILIGQQGDIYAVAISPDSRWVATGSLDSTARVWDLKAEAPYVNPRVLSGHRSAIASMTVTPDSRWIITGSFDNSLSVWDLIAENPSASPRVLQGRQFGIPSVVITPDSRWVITSSNDNTAHVWDLAAPDPAAGVRTLGGHQAPITRMAVSRDSRWVVTGSHDGTAQVWNLTAGNAASQPRVLRGHQKAIIGLAISADSRWIVTAGEDRTAQVWDMADDGPPAHPRVLGGHQADITHVAISPDSRWVITAYSDGSARAWDTAAADPGSRPRVLSGHAGPVASLVVSPNSRWMATESHDKTARVWQLTTESLPSNEIEKPHVLSRHVIGIPKVTISPDSRWIVANGGDKTAHLEHGAEDLARDHSAVGRVLSGHQDLITGAAISPDSRWIITGSDDRTARIWDLAADDPSESPRVLSGHQGVVRSVAISPDGRWILTWSKDKTVRIWAWRWDDLVALAGKTGRNFDRQEWNLYFSGEPYRKTFPDLPIPGEP